MRVPFCDRKFPAAPGRFEQCFGEEKAGKRRWPVSKEKSAEEGIGINAETEKTARAGDTANDGMCSWKTPL